MRKRHSPEAIAQALRQITSGFQFHGIAEALRAWVGANDTPSLWPRAARERLWAIDPRMAAIVASLFANELAA